MQLTSEQRIYVVTNYLKTRSFKEVPLFFEKRIRELKWTFEKKHVKEYKTERSTLNLNKDLSGRRRSERTQENINFLQEQLIDDPRISARNNCLDISKSTFSRITKRDLKWHPYKMHVWKGGNNYKSSWFTERKSRFT